MLKSSVKYSFLCGVFLFALFFVSIKFGSNPLLDIRHFLFDAGVFFLFIFFAGKEYKDFKNEGYLHFWQGISIGLIVLIPAVILFSISFFVIFDQNPELIDGYRAGAKALLESKKEIFLKEFSQEQFNEQLAAVGDVTNWQLVTNTFWKKLFAGFFVTPVVSIILRKKPK